MKSRVVVASLLGSLSVYVVMAACTKSDQIFGTGGSGGSGQGGEMGQGGVGGTNSGGTDDAGIMDVLSDAMPDASADPVSGSRLKAKYRLGEDGSKAYLPFVWYDSERKEDCNFSLAADAKERCLPLGTYNAVLGTYFSDSACTAPLALALYPSCEVKYATGAKSGGGCQFASTMTQVFVLGAKANLATVYVKSGANCISTSGTGVELYEVGTEIPPSSFVAGTVMADQ